MQLSRMSSEWKEKKRKEVTKDDTQKQNRLRSCSEPKIKEVCEMANVKTKVVYTCVKPGCKTKEFETHPAEVPVCCGEPMKKIQDTCCEPECGPKTCA